MHVNVRKTKIVIFNRRGNEVQQDFTFDDRVIAVESEFKYLGLIFHESRRQSAMIEHRVSQGKRLIAAWMRRCDVWMMKPEMGIQLFKTCVMPALEYGLGLWGAGSFTSGAWKQLEVFWRTAARTILKAPLRTPSEALLSDLGWTKFWTRGAWQAVCLWSRVTRMGEDELARKAMYMQREMLRQNKECWLSTLRSTLVATAAGQEM